MRRRGLDCVAALLFALSSARAVADGTPGRFDYWVLSLSWSPEYCQANIGDEQCRQQYGFVVHGLWPQYDRGYPSRCASRARVPDALIARMLPLMPSEKLIRHEWDTHGTCSGLSQDDYFALIERVRRKIEIPAEYQNPDAYISTRVDELERTFIRDNRSLAGEDIAVQCKGRYLQEVRICFDTPQLNPQACGRDVDDHCRDQVVLRPNR
ncbi:MAG: ribonuclease T2 [Solimonas sp.]